MTIDLYTKAVLSVIAACLVLLVCELGTSPAHAGAGVSKVAICDPSGRFCANVGPAQFNPETVGVKVFPN
jgi:hypothetical protein